MLVVRTRAGGFGGGVVTDDEKPKIHEQDPTLLAPASRPSVPSAGKPIKAATARSLNRDTGEWTYRQKNVQVPCGQWFAEGGNDFRCALKDGHEQHALSVAKREHLSDDACGYELVVTDAGPPANFYCNKPRGHDRHRHALKDHGESTLADIGYVTNSARAMRGEPENLDHQDQAVVQQHADIHWAQARAIQQAERDVDRENLTLEQRLAEARRRAKHQHVNLSSEFMILRRLLNKDKTDKAKDRVRRIEGLLDQAA
jgi:hypothetical protein